MLVEVRQEHIDLGKKGDPIFCPLALAISESLWQASGAVLVFGFYAQWHRKGFNKPQCLKLPYDAQEFLRHYDAGLSVGPMSFVINVG